MATASVWMREPALPIHSGFLNTEESEVAVYVVVCRRCIQRLNTPLPKRRVSALFPGFGIEVVDWEA
jgi:hypothetical protein